MSTRPPSDNVRTLVVDTVDAPPLPAGAPADAAALARGWGQAPAPCGGAEWARSSAPPRVVDAGGAAPRPARLAFAGPGDADADYVLEACLGRGGMGVVYRARQRALGRTVALKVIDPAADGAEAERRVRLLREAALTGALDHPNIVPVHDLGVTGDGCVFYAMKEVRGAPWSDSVAERTEADNLDILARVADAVAFAHDAGVVHRDIKPENVMLGDYGEVLLADWGLAAPYRPGADGGRAPFGRAGTPAYMAPEMARGDDARIGPASDVYLLGATLYRLLAGRPPHGGGSRLACLVRAANNEIGETERDDEPMRVARRAMAARPQDRYPTAGDSRRALADLRRHADSRATATRARAHLARARHSGAAEDINRAIFGFGEALAQWPGNEDARAGERAARLALMEQAVEDFARSEDGGGGEPGGAPGRDARGGT